MSSAVKSAYGTTVTGTGGLTSLASSSTWLAGYEWFFIDNASELALDYLVELVIRMGTTPTINTEVRAYAFPVGDGGTVFPDVMDGTPSAETVTAAGVRDGFAKLAAVAFVDATTSSRDYPINFNLRDVFRSLPKKVGVFITHNCVAALDGTAGNHKYQYTPQYENVG